MDEEQEKGRWRLLTSHRGHRLESDLLFPGCSLGLEMFMGAMTNVTQDGRRERGEET